MKSISEIDLPFAIQASKGNESYFDSSIYKKYQLLFKIGLLSIFIIGIVIFFNIDLSLNSFSQDSPVNVYDVLPTSSSIFHSSKDYPKSSLSSNSNVELVLEDNQIDFTNAKFEAVQLLNLIRTRYELNGPIGSQFFLTANNIGSFQWDILKYKFAKKILEKDSSFLMIFGGSSVTAGHDNYYNQSYPSIVRKRMKPLFNSLGIKLIVHNIAQGANNCIPYSFCYESMGGTDPDFVGWEQSYNCGHDDPIFELVARYAGWSKNQGVTYYSASGAWLPSDCPASSDSPPFCSEEFKQEDATDFKFWNVDKATLNEQKKLLNEYYEAQPSASRFVGWMNKQDDLYHGTSPHGFNVWEQNPKCEFINKEGKPAKKCSGIDATQHCALRFMTKEAAVYGSDEGTGAGWHPSRAFHMLRGEAISWLYTLTLLDAIYMVDEDLKSQKSKDVMYSEYSNQLNKLHPSLPSPKRCSSYHCEFRPLCFTDYRPHYSKNMTLSELLVGSTNWTLDDNEYPEWSIHYGYLDLKPIYVTNDPSLGELSLRIHISSNNFILLCSPFKDSLANTLFYIDFNINVSDTIQQNYTPSSDRQLWTNVVNLGHECIYLQDLPQGKHVISLAPNTTDDKIKSWALSHVIMWP